MAKYAQGIFTPKNPQKYVGKHAPKYRSGWEEKYMNYLDSNLTTFLKICILAILRNIFIYVFSLAFYSLNPTFQTC
jgi:hypothetical protein